VLARSDFDRPRIDSFYIRLPWRFPLCGIRKIATLLLALSLSAVI